MNAARIAAIAGVPNRFRVRSNDHVLKKWVNRPAAEGPVAGWRPAPCAPGSRADRPPPLRETAAQVLEIFSRARGLFVEVFGGPPPQSCTGGLLVAGALQKLTAHPKWSIADSSLIRTRQGGHDWRALQQTLERYGAFSAATAGPVAAGRALKNSLADVTV